MNREIVGSGGATLYPLAGDVKSTAGNNTTTVVGLQNISVSSTFPLDGNVLTYKASTNKWTPSGSSSGNSSVQVNGVTISDDYSFLCNNIGMEVLVSWTRGFSKQVFINGV